MSPSSRRVWVVLVTAVLAVLAIQCGSNSAGVEPNADAGDDASPPLDASQTDSADAAGPTFTVGGSIAGYTGQGLVLRNSGGDDLVVPAGATSFTFPTPLASGSPYVVAVKTQPTNPSQICTVQSGSGTVSGGAITNVIIQCAVATFRICPTVSDLAASTGDAGLDDAGTGTLVLSNNAGDAGAGESLGVSANGKVCFPTPVASGSKYAVTVVNPTNPHQTCTVAGGSGTVTSADVTSILVNCSTDTFSLGGAVTGLLGSVVLTARDAPGNDLHDVTVSSTDATYAFTTPLPSGRRYQVVVKTQPGSPVQTCSVANATGQIDDAAVSNVDISCTTTDFTVSGTIENLAGSGLVLQNNAGSDKAISGTGTVPFSYTVASGAPYAISVLTNPSSPTQSCVVTSGGSGVVTNADVSGIVITCTTSTFTVSGSITGLTGSGLALRNNGANDQAINGTGTVPFSFQVPSGAAYAVSVGSQPTNQFCGGSSLSGVVANANVGGLVIACGGRVFDFAYTGAMQTFTVPAGAANVAVELNGAQGATGGGPLGGAGALGGFAAGTYATSGGTVLNVFVGGASVGTAGGFNGGGSGGTAQAGGGGGASDIRVGGTDLGSRVIVAGGGGGGGTTGCPGAGVPAPNGTSAGGAGGGGGGVAGSKGADSVAGGGGAGGTVNAGGAVGIGCAFASGASGTVPNGGAGATNCCCVNAPGGGGGGGGYLPGGGGGGGTAGTTMCTLNDTGAGGGGAGGSSYVGTLTSTSTLAGVRVGNGSVRITVN